MSLQGAIEELGLCELIQALALNRYRGTLRIEPDGAPSQFFYLNEGEIVLLRTVDSEPVRIGELLLRARLVSQEQLDDALRVQKTTTHRRLGDTLVSLGYVEPKAIEKVVHLRFEEEFLDIFLLDRGRFEFIFGLTPEALFPAERVERIALNTSSLMLEAMRRVDEWHALLKELGSLDEIYEKRVDRPTLDGADIALSRLTATQRTRTFDYLDGRKSLREILGAVQEAGSSRLAALHFIEGLKRKNLIASLGADDYLARLAQALSSNDVDGTAKLIRCLLAKGPIDAAVVDQYIEFVRASGRPLLARQQCKLLGGHYLGTGEVDRAVSLYERALESDPRDTEVLDRLFYAYLRRSDIEHALGLYAPLREAIARERELGTVSRIVKNMKELAPRDPRVLELSGLVAKREERLDDARAELEAALAAANEAGVEEAKKSGILQALSEVDPSRPVTAGADGRRRSDTTRTAIPRPSGIAAPRRSRGPWAVVAVLALAAPFVAEEVRGRSELERARRAEAAAGPGDRLAALGLYESASGRLSSVRGAAQVRADALARELGVALRAPAAPPTSATPAASPPPPPPAASDSDLADYEAARRRNVWPLAAKLARRLHDAALHGGADERAAKVRMPFRLATRPEGAHVSVDGAEPRTTPCMLEAPVDAKVALTIKKPGFASQELTVVADEWRELSVDLVPGPSWKRPLKGVAALAGSARAAVALVRPATLVGLSLEDGTTAWERVIEGEGDLGAPAFSQGRVVASARSGALVTLTPEGEEKARIATKRALFPPQSVDVADSERTLLTASDALVVVDVADAKVLREIALPAAPVAPPALKANRAWVLLADGSVVAADLVKGSVIWTADPRVQAAGGPVLAGGTLALAARDGSLLGLSLSNGAVAWRRAPKVAGLADAGALADESRVVTVSSARLVSFDAKDGKPLWEEPLGAAGAVLRVSGRLFVPSATGELLEVEAGSGKTVARYPLDAPVVGLAATARFIVVASGNAVSAIDRGE